MIKEHYSDQKFVSGIGLIAKGIKFLLIFLAFLEQKLFFYLQGSNLFLIFGEKFLLLLC